MKAHMRPEEYEKRRDRLIKLLTLYKDAASVKENYADGKVNEQEMSQDDFNTIGNVLRDSSKAKQIHALLVQEHF